MNRRTFCQELAALAAGALWMGRVHSPVPETGPAMKNWIWAPVNTERSPDEWKRALASMRQNGVQAVLLEVYDGQHAYFASHHLPVKTDCLGRILPLAKAEGIEIHAWMWSLPCRIPEILQKHPDWYNVNALGESAALKPAYVDYYKFLDPGRPEVREWIQTTVRELGGIGELRGVHLDYIRHPDAILPRGLWKKYGIVQDRVYPQYDYGYSAYERAQFQKNYGVDPLRIGRSEVPDPTLRQEWLQFQLDMVVGLVNDYLVPAAHATQKPITAAVFPGPSLARQMVRQDWARFQVDAFFPMLYNTFYETGPEWVGEMSREAVHAVKVPIYSGLYVQDAGPELISDLVRRSRAAGAAGVSLFSLDAMDSRRWVALRQLAS
jgi:uncharacterized lipoprotein YddW (UPF0748 family)